MNRSFKAIRVTDDVWWVGAIDWNLREFHGYHTKEGSTYNAYLVMADKIALIDTVKAAFREEMFSRIASVVEPSRIAYIISNHAEMDHSGGLPETMAAVKPEKVFASTVGVKTLEELLHFGGTITPVKDGEALHLGNRTLTFLETRMLHWPDSMVTYLKEEELLFSQDAFGMHLASQERFDDEVDPAVLAFEAATYYANILLPYSSLIQRLLERIQGLGIGLKCIAPDHGPIWRRDITGILGRYAKWAAQKPEAKGVVVYGTMWHSTERMARAIGEGMAQGGLEVRLLDVEKNHRSDVLYEILCAGALAVGSSTLNNQMLPVMADVMTYLKGLKPRNLVGAAFGSYGWSGEAVKQLEEILGDMKVESAGEGIRVKNAPDDEVLDNCFALGQRIADLVKARLQPNEGQP